MDKVLKFLSSHRHAILWTGLYVFVMWSVLNWLFHFDMFAVTDWNKVQHLRLQGLPGFVFGLLVLAAIPLYIATIVVVDRSKSVPVKIPLPKCFAPQEKKKEEKPEVVPLVKEVEPLPELPAHVPPEMREQFARARKNYGSRAVSAFNRASKELDKNDSVVQNVKMANVTLPATEPVAVVEKNADRASSEYIDTDSSFPVPSDFDMEEKLSEVPVFQDIPVFSDLKFDDDTNNEIDKDEIDTKGDTGLETELVAFLNKHKLDAHKSDNLVICKEFAIAIHDDDDFWVADELDWFAAGKQKPSPILTLDKAERDGLTPVLFLMETNIMDLDKLIDDWTKRGIKVVKTKEELVSVVSD